MSSDSSASGSSASGSSASDSPKAQDSNGVTEDGRSTEQGAAPQPSSNMRSYALLTPELKNLYMGFYKATYGKSHLDIKTKEFVAIGAALATGCKGCLEGHLKKAKKHGATSDEIAEVIAVTLGVAAATIVDRSDIANFNLGELFGKPSDE